MDRDDLTSSAAADDGINDGIEVEWLREERFVMEVVESGPVDVTRVSETFVLDVPTESESSAAGIEDAKLVQDPYLPSFERGGEVGTRGIACMS